MMMSGPPVRKFRSGWALKPFGAGGKRAHFFVREEGTLAQSKCGRTSALGGQLLQAGNWRRCVLCADALDKAQAEGERG